MKKLNVDFLIEISIENLIRNINNIFNDLILEVKSYLNLDLLNKNLEWVPDFEASEYTESFFDIGIKKNHQNGLISICIYKSYLKFTPVLLLREAYKCFIPYELQENEIINIFINQKVEIDLQRLPNIKEWSALFKEKTISYEFLSAEFDRLDKFLKRESTISVESPFQYFFQFIRRNVQIMGEQKEHFYDAFYRDYVSRFSKSLYADDMIETLRVIVEIFYKTKRYTALLNYQDYFKKFKKEKVLVTELSLRNFTANMTWIKKYSDIAPSYQINWVALNLIPILINLEFNPSLKKKDINLILKEFPFIISQRSSRTNFSVEIYGYCILPNNYYKDFVEFIGKLEDYGYIIRKNCFLYKTVTYFKNLNYLRNFAMKNHIINFKNPMYEKNFEIEFNMDYLNKRYNKALSIIEWLLIDRIRFFSITGFGFERKAITLQNLKSDYINEILSQRLLIKKLKKNLEIFSLNDELKKNFFVFLNSNRLKGFFYIKNMLNTLLNSINLISDYFKHHPSISNSIQFQNYLVNYSIKNTIEENILFNQVDLKRTLFREIIPLYFKSKKLYNKKVNEYQSYYNVLKSCQDLKIFKIKTIEALINNKSKVDNIFKKKEQKLKKYYENYKDYRITYNLIENHLSNFLKNDLIKPNLINTIFIPFFNNYIPILILKSRLEVLNKLEKIKLIFPQIIILNGSNIYNEMNFLSIDIFIPSLKEKLRKKIFSLIYNLFKDDIIYFKRYLWSGMVEYSSIKDFYDLERKEFFYTPDLFDQFFIYVKSIFGNPLKPLQETPNKNQERLWGKDFSELIDNTEISEERVNLNSREINGVVDFHLDLTQTLFQLDEYNKIKETYFFKNYVKSIRFFPAFENFGLGQYFLYFYPTDLNGIDFKLLLSNYFQKVKYSLSFDNSNSFIIKFLSPYRNPGVIPYLNWLTKSKKIIREYCIFFIKKIYSLLHPNHNLTSDNWDLDPNRFKIYFQNVLFNPDYNIQFIKLKEFNIGDLNVTDYFEPESSEFKALLNVYSWHSLNIKSYLGTKKLNTINYLTELLKKGLIFPYLSLKNLNLYEKLYIVLPNVKKEFTEKIIKIFSFFNYGFIYEVEGEYYIHGFKEQINFENGMMIKLYLPDCQLDEFTKLFDLIFQYLGIDYFLILNDLVDGKRFLKSIYGNLDFLKPYNPLINFTWNGIDKIWMNHKLFNEKFEPIYADLFYGKGKYQTD